MHELALVPASWWATLFGILGLLLGSFSNVVRWRIPRRESILWPGSQCPACQHALTGPDLVPVFSFLFLRARCRHCGAHISWQYLAWEAVFGLAGAVAGYLGGPIAGAAAVGALLLGVFVWAFMARTAHDQGGATLVEVLVALALLALVLGTISQALHVSWSSDRAAWCETQMVEIGQGKLDQLIANKPPASSQGSTTTQTGYGLRWDVWSVDGESGLNRIDLTVNPPSGSSNTCSLPGQPSPLPVKLSTYLRG